MTAKAANCFDFLLLIINWFFLNEKSNIYSFTNELIVFELEFAPLPSEDIQYTKLEVAFVGLNTNPYFLNSAIDIIPKAILILSLAILILTLWFYVVIG